MHSEADLAEWRNMPAELEQCGYCIRFYPESLIPFTRWQAGVVEHKTVVGRPGPTSAAHELEVSVFHLLACAESSRLLAKQLRSLNGSNGASAVH